MIVEKDGRVSEKKILTNTSLLEKEIINAALLQVPPFVPATVEGVPVKSSLTTELILNNKGLRLFPDDSLKNLMLKEEDMPKYPGGMQALQMLIASSIRYPVYAQEHGIVGKVFVNFIVAEDGSVQNVKVAKGIHPSLDAEAVRVIKLMHQWIPGKKDGKPVAVHYTVPVNFQLQ